MSSLNMDIPLNQASHTTIPIVLAGCLVAVASVPALASASDKFTDPTQSYDEPLDDEGNTIAMLPIAAGQFVIGSDDDEPNRRADEGPRTTVDVDGFWMGKHELTWQQFHPYLVGESRTAIFETTNAAGERVVDAITRPSSIAWHIKVLNLGMEDKQPVAGVTQYTAKMYCRWLSAKTGRFYRLPTEAEWEYACRAGGDTAFHFGDDDAELGDYAWFAPNAYDVADEGYQPVGQKKPNAWGLFDMHGNVAEWVLDGYEADAYARLNKPKNANPFVAATSLYPRVTRGGSWKDDAESLRSAARTPSDPEWKEPDPRFPKSKWFHRSGEFVGFRIVRPFAEPDAEERAMAGADEFQE